MPVSPQTAITLCAELRLLRERAGLTGETVARKMGWSPSKISRYEHGRASRLVPAEVAKLLDFYGVAGPLWEQLMGIARAQHGRAWWAMYDETLPTAAMLQCAAEADAVAVRCWCPDRLPPLLAGEPGQRQILRAHTGVERRPASVTSRLGIIWQHRAQVLGTIPVRVLVSTTVASREAGRLAELAALPAVEVAIGPDGLPLPGFTVYEFASAPSVACLDVLLTPALAPLMLTGETDVFTLTEALYEADRNARPLVGSAA